MRHKAARAVRLIVRLRWLPLVLALAVMPLRDWAGGARAGELIEFSNLPDHAPPKLQGYLTRPDPGLSALVRGRSNGDGQRYPAVVVLHGCGGFSSHTAGIANRPRPNSRVTSRQTEKSLCEL
jgi:hypothetical protein